MKPKDKPVPLAQAPALHPYVFDMPAFTQIPNRILDELMPLLSGAELRVLLYTARRTFGFHRQYARIPINQYVEGLVLKGGERMDAGTGLSRRAVIDALTGLERAGYIVGRRTRGANGVTLANTYTLMVRLADGTRFGDELGPEPMPDAPADAIGDSVQNLHSGGSMQILHSRGEGAENAPYEGAKFAPSYKERKKGNKAPLTPQGGRRGRTPTEPTERKPPTPAAPACVNCHGFGLVGTTTCAGPAAHNGTLRGVRSLVDEWGAAFCVCEVGQGWRELYADKPLVMKRKDGGK